ncbi:putative serine incorporator [Drosera capensis]
MDMEANVTKVKYSELREASWFSQFRYGSNPWMARYVYGLIFFLMNLLAWGVRDYGPSLSTVIHRHILNMDSGFEGCKGGGECLGAEGVLRVSFGCFIFFFIMFLATVGTSKLDDPRDSLHSGWWIGKLLLCVILMILPFLIPPAIIHFYGDIAHFGAGVFLLIQLVSIISFITWLNDCCNSDKNVERCHIHVMLLATAAYVICIVGIILLYIEYAQGTCLLNVFFITSTLVLLQSMTSVSRHPQINAGVLGPGLMGLYIVYICWCAMRSEQPGSSCNKKEEVSSTNGGKRTDWLTIISFVIALLAMVIATFSTGIDSQCFQFRKTKKEADDDVPYGYGFFHLVFATGAMYFAMLLIGWNTHHSMEKFTIDIGWTSTWVRIVYEWLAAGVYMWMLVAPVFTGSKAAADEQPS